MKYGKPLPEGGTIGFVAPAFGCNIEPYQSCFVNALRVFEDCGYSLDIGPNCFAGEGIGISNTPELCAKELTEAYLDSRSSCLISCGGGELMCEILDYMDWESIKKAPPKRFMGFSDNTNMTFVLTTMCDVASIYGPCAPAFGVEPWHDVTTSAFGILSGSDTDFTVHGYPKFEIESLKTEEEPLAPFNLTEDKVLIYYGPGLEEPLAGDDIPEIFFEGRLLGGCLDCLANLSGTCYDHAAEFAERYKDDGIIWFLESCDLNVFSIRRAMWQLEHTGWFRYTKGFLIGRHQSGMEPMMGLDCYDAVLGIAAKYDVPVIMDIDLGHLPPSMPLVLGSYGTVHVEGNNIEINMELRP